MNRRWSIVAALMLAFAVLAAGCVKKDDPGDGATTSTSTPPTGTTGGTTPPTSNGTTSGGGNTPPPTVVADKGTFQGEFKKDWPIAVAAVSPKATTITFNLTGVQAGAPPTARVVLQFLDPEGKAIKSATLGLGGSGNNVAWTFGPADVALAGEYKVRATADATVPGPGLPSGGAANYELNALVEY